MMKRLMVPVFAIVALAAFTSSVQAASINQRQHQQQARIHQGLHNGSLTYREAARLQYQQVQIQRHENRVKADGVVTRHERYHLNQHQNAASRNINRQKRDGQRRY
ncbi:MAG: hypothetical protein MI750_03045 [Xanthomonadales bacterium]|nr:hypothetical protein [Xanthomonadales bacterium]